MDLELHRYSSSNESTLGLLFNADGIYDFLCYTLEDEQRNEKVYGKTRIPKGRYEVKLKTHGGFHNRYSKRYKSIHEGMLWLQDVPEFTDILVHTGNKDEDTAGCLLVGDQATQNINRDGYVGYSRNAYRRIYPPIAKAILSGEDVFLRVRNLDTI